MTAREDTIERIERVLKLTHKESITVTIPRLTAERAVSMLKEQEAVEPKKAPFPDASRSDGSWYFICGACSKPIDPYDKYCRECGRPILWEG